MENLVHIAYVLLLISYVVRGILWLRLMTVVGSLTLLPYYYFQSTPLYEAIGWNLAFIAINVFHIVWLLLDRRPVHLKGEELRLYRLVFR